MERNYIVSGKIKQMNFCAPCDVFCLIQMGEKFSIDNTTSWALWSFGRP